MKRKQTDANGQGDEHDGRHKKHRSEEKASSNKSRTSRPKHQRPPSSPPDRPTVARVKSVEDVMLPEPPTGLNASQRKRRRRKLKKQNAAHANDAKFVLPPTQSLIQEELHSPTPSKKRFRPSKVFAMQFAVTKLVKRPAKRWHEDKPAPSRIEAENAPRIKGKNVKQSKTSEAQPPKSDEPEAPSRHGTNLLVARSPDTSRSARSSQSSHSSPDVSSEKGLDVERSCSTRVEDPEAAGRESTNASPTTAPRRSAECLLTQNKTTSIISQAQDISRDLKFSMPTAKPTGFVLRRASTQRKPNSVPSYSDYPDTKTAFERFCAFVEGDGSEESEDESEDGEDGVVHRQPTTRDMEWTPRNPTINERVSSQLQTEIDQTLETRESADRSNSGARPGPPTQESVDDRQLSRISQPPSTQANIPAISWPANVGIKRQISFSGPPGGTRSGTASPFEAATNHGFEDPATLEVFDIPAIESQNVLRAIDEVSKDLFESTRPLPPGKHSRGAHLGDHEEPGVTSDSSAYRVTRSMSTPKKVGKLLPPPEREPLTCNLAQLEHAGARQPMDAIDGTDSPDERGSESLSENIDVAACHPVDTKLNESDSSSSLSELSRTPTPPRGVVVIKVEDQIGRQIDYEEVNEEAVSSPDTHPPRRKRKMTGRTSKHFSPEKKKARKRSSVKIEDMAEATEQDLKDKAKLDAAPPSQSTRSSTQKKKKRKSTGKRSTYFIPEKPPLDPSIIDRVDFYNTTAGSKKKGGRVPAGTSTAPVPTIHSQHFGVIQEKLWREPFWLLIAVTFLNKTTGRAAAPTFWELKRTFETPERLAEADQEELCQMIWHLGLQTQRSRRLIKMAKAWVEAEPVKGMRWRTLHYPVKGDGKVLKGSEAVEEDADEVEGALEIGRIPGCGPYAWDSWRIFCRDALRGVAAGYNGEGTEEGFVPEWQKVLPLDKELRACLRWMWLRGGWIWNHETGDKQRATEEEMEKAVQGEMEIVDPAERKFAVQAAEQDGEIKAEDDSLMENGGDMNLEDEQRVVKSDHLQTPELEQDDMSEEIVVSPVRKGKRRSTRLSGIITEEA